MSKGVGGHHRGHRGKSDEWLTPPEIIASLGPFDLDPCSPVDRPWSTAAKHYTIEDDGLRCDWHGFVWLNPPYGPETGKWLKRLADHGSGIALIFARTDTEMFFREVWRRASSILFFEGRLHFYNVKGERAKANSGAPSVLVGYGNEADLRLARCDVSGQYIKLR